MHRIWCNSRLQAGSKMLIVGACVSGITALLLTYSRGGLLALFVTLLIGMTVVGAWQALRSLLSRCARSLLDAADMEQMVSDQASKAYLSGKGSRGNCNCQR